MRHPHALTVPLVRRLFSTWVELVKWRVLEVGYMHFRWKECFLNILLLREWADYQLTSGCNSECLKLPKAFHGLRPACLWNQCFPQTSHHLINLIGCTLPCFQKLPSIGSWEHAFSDILRIVWNCLPIGQKSIFSPGLQTVN